LFGIPEPVLENDLSRRVRGWPMSSGIEIRTFSIPSRMPSVDSYGLRPAEPCCRPDALYWQSVRHCAAGKHVRRRCAARKHLRRGRTEWFDSRAGAGRVQQGEHIGRNRSQRDVTIGRGDRGGCTTETYVVPSERTGDKTSVRVTRCCVPLLRSALTASLTDMAGAYFRRAGFKKVRSPAFVPA